MEIAIVGAGLGGLTAATCLAKAGHDVVVFEKRDKLPTQGGIIGLRPSALRVLYDHGLQEQVDAVTLPLGESQFNMLLNGQVVRTIDLHEEQAAGEGLSKLVIRPQLSEILYKAAVDAGATIKFDAAVRNLEEDSTTAHLHFEDGSTHSAYLVLAADGIRSRLRSKILSDEHTSECEPIITDSTFYVFRLPAGRLSEEVKQRMFESKGPWVKMTAWLGKDSWAMTALDNSDDALNVGVTIVEPTSQTSLWDEGGDMIYVRDYFKQRACNDILEALNAADSCDRWRLAYMPSLPRWTSQNGRVALLGDAAHAILPNGGAGITLTIEDVGALIHLLSRYGSDDVPKTLRLWQQACKPRADKLREYGAFNMRRMQGDKEAHAKTERSLKEEAPNRHAAVPDMNAPFSTLSFSRWLSGYDPIAAVRLCLSLTDRRSHTDA